VAQRASGGDRNCRTVVEKKNGGVARVTGTVG
jgi:hypothetical protein